MPIDRAEFSAGETHDAVEGRVVEFLETHRETAYTGEEIAVAIGHPAGRELVGSGEVDTLYHIVQRAAFLSMLDVMAWQHKIERRHVRTGLRSETFYAATPPGGDDPPAGASGLPRSGEG
jgi:hypothetical protein